MSALGITPVVLTWNEAANIERTLSRLAWAPTVLVVDSGSDDGTQGLAKTFSNVEVVERKFDEHVRQWEFAIRRPEVATHWVLALDADYVLSEELVEELGGLEPEPGTTAYRARFRYCIDGRALRAAIYPPVLVLFDKSHSRFEMDGHTQRLATDGRIQGLRGEIFHDDRKPFERFVEAQRRYARLEADRILTTPWSELPWSARIRRLRWVASWSVPLYVLLGKGLILDGSAGLKYANQRRIAESMISRAVGRGLSERVRRNA